MKRIFCFIMFSLLMKPVAAQDPLMIAVDLYNPPFSLKAGHNQIYGFDLDMMRFICTEIHRDCQFKTMLFSEVITALINNQYDIGLGSITITPERLKEIYFSKPYMQSFAQFITTYNPRSPSFNIEMLNNKTIGIEENTAFAEVISSLHVINPQMVVYKLEGDIIEALAERKIDYAIVDIETANYWSRTNSDIISVAGLPIPYGLGLAIGINPKEPGLVPLINGALDLYLKSAAYRLSYDTYFFTMK